jgi:hypothetical protein
MVWTPGGRGEQGRDEVATRGKPCWKATAGHSSEVVAQLCWKWMTLGTERSEDGGWGFLWGEKACNCQRLRSCRKHNAKEWVSKLFWQTYRITGRQNTKMGHRTLIEGCAIRINVQIDRVKGTKGNLPACNWQDKADAATPRPTQSCKFIHRKEQSIFRRHSTVFPLIDSVSNRNEYQEYLQGRGDG